MLAHGGAFHILHYKSQEALLNHFTEGRVEAHVIEVLVADCFSILSLVLDFKGVEGLSQRVQIDFNRLMPVNSRVLGERIGLVKVVIVVHERASDRIEDYWSIGSE